jgi:hypothetical protein
MTASSTLTNGEHMTFLEHDSEKILVYVAGPYSDGGKATMEERRRNVTLALKVADRCIRSGLVPFTPHLSHHFDTQFPHDYEVWLEMDMAILKRCNCLFRMEGESAGADQEELLAGIVGIPCFRDFNAMVKHWKDK